MLHRLDGNINGRKHEISAKSVSRGATFEKDTYTIITAHIYTINK